MIQNDGRVWVHFRTGGSGKDMALETLGSCHALATNKWTRDTQDYGIAFMHLPLISVRPTQENVLTVWISGRRGAILIFHLRLWTGQVLPLWLTTHLMLSVEERFCTLSRNTLWYLKTFGNTVHSSFPLCPKDRMINGMSRTYCDRRFIEMEGNTVSQTEGWEVKINEAVSLAFFF